MGVAHRPQEEFAQNIEEGNTVHPKFQSMTPEERQEYLNMCANEAIGNMVKHCLTREQALRMFAHASAIVLFNIKREHGDFEMRMAETRMIDYLHAYADEAAEKSDEDITGRYGPKGKIS